MSRYAPMVAFVGVGLGIVIGAATSCVEDCPVSAPDPGIYSVTDLSEERILTATMKVTEDEAIIIEYTTDDGDFAVTYQLSR